MLGACLCGAVQIDVEVNSEEITVCHCSMCRTWGGGPALTVESTQKSSLLGSNLFENMTHRNGQRDIFASSAAPICFTS